MGGERQSTTRRRLAGKICCACKIGLRRTRSPVAAIAGATRAKGGWHIQLLEADLQTPLPRKLTFADPAKIIEMAERGGALKDLAARQHWTIPWGDEA
jgi:hypothetical protein